MSAYSKWFFMPSLSASNPAYAVESSRSLPSRFKADLFEICFPSVNILV
jgi:hypothetical protein